MGGVGFETRPRGLRALLLGLVLAAGAMVAGGHEGGAAGEAWQVAARPLPALDGFEHRLEEWRGRVVVLNFWASWCRPCESEVAALAEWQRRHDGDGLQVIGVGMDAAEALRSAGRALGINYPVLVADPARYPRLPERWGNGGRSVPYTIVIDRDGRVRHRHDGVLDRAAFDRLVLPLFGAS